MTSVADPMTPRRQWRFVTLERPGDRLVCAALTAYRVAIREGHYTVLHERGGADHLSRRLEERGLHMAAALRAVAQGRICAFELRGFEYDRDSIGGGYLLDDVMVYVKADAARRSSFYDLVPCLCSAWRIDPIECRPLTTPLSELARLAGAP